MSESTVKRVALIIGGSSGIGYATAKLLSAGGYQLHLAGRDAVKLQEAGDELAATTTVLDARDGAAVGALFDEVLATHQSLDAVVNCAGSILLKPAHLTSEIDFAETIAQNLTTAFNVVRAAG
ncbi:MAG TPA: SDR family oxidoreductase, partial [Verrucomicrobiae bacterium]